MVKNVTFHPTCYVIMVGSSLLSTFKAAAVDPLSAWRFSLFAFRPFAIISAFFLKAASSSSVEGALECSAFLFSVGIPSVLLLSWTTFASPKEDIINDQNGVSTITPLIMKLYKFLRFVDKKCNTKIQSAMSFFFKEQYKTKKMKVTNINHIQ